MAYTSSSLVAAIGGTRFDRKKNKKKKRRRTNEAKRKRFVQVLYRPRSHEPHE